MGASRTGNSSKRKRGRAGRADLVAAFSYFRTPEFLGGEGEYSLALDSATARLESAWRCHTWGEFAHVIGLTWDDFMNEWGDEIVEVSGEQRPCESSPLAFAHLWGDARVVSELRDPRECAYEFLRQNVEPRVWNHSRLEGLLDWGGSSPGGCIDVVTSKSSRGFTVLQEVLHEAGYGGLTFYTPAKPAVLLGCVIGVRQEQRSDSSPRSTSFCWQETERGTWRRSSVSSGRTDVLTPENGRTYSESSALPR